LYQSTRLRRVKRRGVHRSEGSWPPDRRAEFRSTSAGSSIAAPKPADYFRDKVVRLTGKVERWPDRGKPGAMAYRICVADLDNLAVVK